MRNELIKYKKKLKFYESKNSVNKRYIESTDTRKIKVQ